MKKLAILLCAILMCTTASAQEWTEHMVDGDFPVVRSVFASDVDGDGDVDVLGSRGVGITWWENDDGSGTQWTAHTVDNGGAESLYAADVDGDGDMDILGAVPWDDEIVWWENVDGVGTLWVEHPLDGDFENAGSVHAADVDGDGDTDILGESTSGEYPIIWMENVDGVGSEWTRHPVYTDFNHAASVYATDIDGDSDTDVLAAVYYPDSIRWWENIQGDGTEWTEHIVDDVFGLAGFTAECVYAADVNGDGYMDVINVAYYTDQVAWWENIQGDGTEWTEHIVDSYFDQAYSVHAADLDGDGDTDILGARHGFRGGFRWWENTNAVGTSWTEHIVQEISCAEGGGHSVYAADVDGDGDPDVIGAVSDDNYIAWYENSLQTTVNEHVEGEYLQHYDLVGIYPNPLNGLARVDVHLPKPATLTLVVFNIMGQHVASLADGSYTTGTHTFTFDATNLSSGIYFLRATVPGQLDQTQKLVLMK